MQSSRLMPMVTVRTSRLSCVNISMVSRMSPVFIMLIVVCLSFVAAEGSPSGRGFLSDGVHRVENFLAGEVDLHPHLSGQGVHLLVQLLVGRRCTWEMSTSMIMANMPCRMLWVTSSMLMFSSLQRPETRATTPTVSWPMTVMNAFIIPTPFLSYFCWTGWLCWGKTTGRPGRPADNSASSIADSTKNEHSFWKKEQGKRAKECLSPAELAKTRCKLPGSVLYLSINIATG